MGAVVNMFGYMADSLTNLVSRMGTDRDKAASSFYGAPLLDDAQLLNAYRGAWLPRKIVDIPAFDSVRAWRDWQAEQDQIEAIEAEEKRLQVRSKVLDARVKARLWGGAAIHIGTGDQNLAEPLDVEHIGTAGIKHLTVLTRRQLSAGEIERDVASEWFGRPKAYRLTSGDQVQVDIHPSRLVIFAGNPQPDIELIGGSDLVWGDSVLLAVMEAIKQADGTAANIASLVFEAKVDVFRIPNFMAQLRDEGYKTKLLERLTLAATAKGINGALLLDKEEEYDTKSPSFATLPDILDRFLQIVSGAADIPATRLLGQAPAGLNATGESDLRNYYDRLSAMQEVEMTPAMHRMDEALIRSALGTRPAEVYYEWAPLWGMSEKEKAEVFKMKADAGRSLAGSAAGTLLPVEALSDALVNTFTEDGSLPGLEAAIEEYGSLAEQEPSAEEQAAALGLRQLGRDPAKQAFDAKSKRGKGEEASGGLVGNRHGNHFDPSQARGANGRWIETGAEGRQSFEMSTEGRKAIADYTGAGHKAMNWQLRGYGPDNPTVTERIKGLDAALSGWTLGQPATVYRGIGSLGAKKLASAGLKKGTIIEDPGFMSTSRSPAIARSFAQQSRENMVLEIKAGKSAKALDVRDYSDAGGSEQEVLFARNSRLKVLSFDKKSRTLVVETVDD